VSISYERHSSSPNSDILSLPISSHEKEEEEVVMSDLKMTTASSSAKEAGSGDSGTSAASLAAAEGHLLLLVLDVNPNQVRIDLLMMFFAKCVFENYVDLTMCSTF
jgi:hypothetical protein